MLLLVGLGNPGTKYAGNRHNVGFMAVDRIAADHGFGPWKPRFQGLAAEGRLGSVRVTLLKPQGFMNLSGQSVGEAMRYLKLTPADVIVLHDELDLPFDSIKVKQGGGHGGHNGLRDIAKALDTPEFLRVRIGIGRPPGQQDPADFVLKPFASGERDTLAVLLEDAADAVEALADDGLLATQQRFHGRSAK